MLKTKLAAGNWKMNGLSEDLIEIEHLLDEIGELDCGFPGVARSSYNGTDNC